MIVHTLKLCTFYMYLVHISRILFTFFRVFNSDIFLFKMLRWCLVCLICNSNSFHSLIFKLCSYIEHVYLLFCAHLVIIFLFLVLLNLDTFPSEMLRGCLVCVICISSSFHSFIFKLSIMIVHTLNMSTLYFVHI